MTSPTLILLLLLTTCFSLGTYLEPHSLQWSVRARSDSLLATLFGDSRRLFANHFFVKADVYFHSGYYPGIFDTQPIHDKPHMAEQSHESHAEEGKAEDHGHDEAGGFLGKPKDWLDRFSRHFYITKHTHLQPAGERELLPWLRISADLDPHRIETYTVAAYWLRTRLGRVDEAEQFLREGLQANPNHPTILYELGQVYFYGRHDPSRARNVWELALRQWMRQEAPKKEPDTLLCEQITASLAHLEEEAGNWPQTIRYLELLKKVSPVPDQIQKQIDQLRAKLK